MEEHYIPMGDGVQLHAWVFRPTRGTDGAAAITMAHGFSGLKYRGLQRYAERFADAGFTVVVHDHRNFGLSGGGIRGDIDPWQQVADWRRVITWLRALPGHAQARVGIWGTSYAGGHAMVLGATDARISAVVTQVPTISGYDQGLRRVPADARPAQQALFDQDERGQLAGEPPMRQKVVSLDLHERAAYRSREMIAFHDAFETPAGVEDSEFITIRSSRLAQMYEPGHWLPRIGPKPLLMVVAREDTITPTDLQLAAYERAVEPKRLVLVPGGHFDAYLAQVETTSSAALAWFREHLLPTEAG